MSGLIADSRTLVDRARVEAQVRAVFTKQVHVIHFHRRGARWPNGRASDFGVRGWRVMTYLRCVVSLVKIHLFP